MDDFMKDMTIFVNRDLIFFLQYAFSLSPSPSPSCLNFNNVFLSRVNAMFYFQEFTSVMGTSYANHHLILLKRDAYRGF
jgi:hypothetical protein